MRHPERLMFCLMLVACSGKSEQVLPGYVEAEYTRVAAPTGGRLMALPVQRGQSVAAGAPLFVLEQTQEIAAVAEAGARLARQSASAADLSQGKRQDELAVLSAQQAQAEAAVKLSQADLARQQALAGQGFLSSAALDAARSRVKSDAARLAEVVASLRVARLAARGEQREAAEADVRAARASLAQSEWQRDQKAVSALRAARVDDTLYRVGEWVPAGSPVVSLLEPDALKLRFFVPQADLHAFAPGTRVEVRCDGCAVPVMARVEHVAQSPEFTPPVIYSKESRARLVFLVEARPEQSEGLRPGQPVDVRRMPSS
ncbi:HlyD family secretion protein [Uliginosibacterium paludis]|uniref:HlyD family efflux transporter periplasmic adaptor subunit n=1 Tax=Uliginosibacterium paludis TaxID=1615952 RepID=A0ABV2CPZ0_9RHOO